MSDKKDSIESELDALFPVSTQITNRVAYGSMLPFELAAAMQSFSDTDKHLLEQAMNILFERQPKDAQTAQMERWTSHKWRIFKVSNRDYTTSPRVAAETVMSSLDAKTIQVFVGKNAVELKDGQITKKLYVMNHAILVRPIIRANLDEQGLHLWYTETNSTGFSLKFNKTVRTFLGVKDDDHRDLTSDEIERLRAPSLKPSDLSLQHWIKLMHEDSNMNIDCFGDYKSTLLDGNIHRYTHKLLRVWKFTVM